MDTAPSTIPTNTTILQNLSITESRALSLLGSGIEPVTVAASLGLTQGRISQLLSDEYFAAQVAELRYHNLAKHNERDSEYDSIEDRLLERLRDCLPLMHRPMEILRAIQVINAAKRRGSSTPQSIIEKQSVVQLVIPVQIINKFSTNLQGQVVSVGEQNLLTIQSGALDGLVKKQSAIAQKELENGTGTRSTETFETKRN
jgi:hypothetical protein